MPGFRLSEQEEVMSKYAELHRFVQDTIPESRHRSIALTHLETSLLFAREACDPSLWTWPRGDET